MERHLAQNMIKRKKPELLRVRHWRFFDFWVPLGGKDRGLIKGRDTPRPSFVRSARNEGFFLIFIPQEH